MTELGQIQAIYKISKIKLLLGFFFLLLISWGFPILIVVNWYTGEIKNFSSFALVMLIIGVPFFLFGIFILLRTPRMLRCRICIYENGILLVNVKGEFTAKWSEIENIERKIHKWVRPLIHEKRQYSYAFTKKDGVKFEDYGGQLKNSEEIGKKLEIVALKFGIPIHIKEHITRIR